jgi:sec-independent protein translocase protein TatB
MFPLEQGAFEMLLIGAIALIVVGPKDLPMLMRKVGQFTAKMRGLAAEFRASFDEMARQSELDDLRKEVEALRTGQYTAPVSAEIDQHLSGFHTDPYPSAYPSPAPDPEPASFEIAPGGDIPPETAPETELGIAPAPAVTPKRPRAKKTVSADAPPADKPAAARPRAPRTPKSKSSTTAETEG